MQFPSWTQRLKLIIYLWFKLQLNQSCLDLWGFTQMNWGNNTRARIYWKYFGTSCSAKGKGFIFSHTIQQILSSSSSLSVHAHEKNKLYHTIIYCPHNHSYKLYHKTATALVLHLKMWPSSFQIGFIFLWIKLSSIGIWWWRKRAKRIDGKLLSKQNIHSQLYEMKITEKNPTVNYFLSNPGKTSNISEMFVT